MPKAASKTQENKQPKPQPLNKLKGGSYTKDPETGELTLVQETERKAPKAEK